MNLGSPFDVLVNNFFSNTGFTSLDSRIGYPTDIYETENQLNIEVAAIGLDKKDIAVEVDGDILRISYNKDGEVEDNKNYLYKGITKKSFSLGWKIACRYDLSKIKVSLEKGMLLITIPSLKENTTVKKIEIE